MLIKYDNIDQVYREISERACGRQACSVVLLVACDVDAITASKLITYVLRSENIAYKVRPVQNFDQIKLCLQEFLEMDVKSLIFINCGATYNIPKHFGLDRGGDLRCYIFDSHRPMHLANIHSRGNVQVLEGTNFETNLDEDYPSDGSDIETDLDSASDDDDEITSDPDSPTEWAEGDSVSSGDESRQGSKANDNEDDAEFENADIDAVPVDGEVGGAADNEVQSERSDATESRISTTEPEPDARDNDSTISETVANEPHVLGDLQSQTSNVLSGSGDRSDTDDEIVIGRRKKSQRMVEKESRKMRRARIRSYYGAGHYHTIATSVQLINLIKLLNMPCSDEILWMAILGLTDQYSRSLLSEEEYSQVCDCIQAELRGDGPSAWRSGEGADEVQVPGDDNGKVFDVMDLRLFLYRHWTIFDSMKHSRYIATKLDAWRGAQGQSKLLDLVAALGAPLHQLKQNYRFMDPVLRGQFRQLLCGEVAQAQGLRDPGAVYKTFYRCFDFRSAVAAFDLVHCVQALLDSAPCPDLDGSDGPQLSWQRTFNEAYDCLSLRKCTDSVFKKGIELAITQQTALLLEAASLLEDGGKARGASTSASRICRVKAFRYAFVKQSGGTASDAPFAKSHRLSALANFLISVQVGNGMWIGKQALPLVLLAENRGTYLVLGVNPPADAFNDKRKSFRINFRSLFKLAADQSDANYRNDMFDPSAIEIDRNDVMVFLENLTILINSK